jgi:hypothetical protein
MFMASLGHSATQDSQPVHFSPSTFAGIYITLSKKLITTFAKPQLLIEYGMLQNCDDITTHFEEIFERIARFYVNST